MGDNARNYQEIEEDKKKDLKKKKLKRIKTEQRRLQKSFANIDPEVLKTVKSLIENAAFMVITLSDLQDEINFSGCVSTYQNGENQWGTKKSPEVEVYNTMIKNHMSVMKQLTDLIPKSAPKEDDDGYEDFINARED